MVTVAIADNGDGTGGVATISQTEGADWILYAGASPVNYKGAAFTAVASGTGDDEVDLELAAGGYLWVLVADGVPYGPTPFRITDGDVGTHYRCLTAIRDLVLGLALPLVPANPQRHLLRKAPLYTVRDLGEDPSGVHYWSLPERSMYADNGHERTIYPIFAMFLLGNEKEVRPDYRWTLSRQLLRIQSTGKALPGAPEIDVVTVNPGPLYDLDFFEKSLDQHTLIFECQTDECFRV